MIKDLFQIQNYKLFLSNMTMLGMAVAITTPFLVIFMTEVHGMSTTSYGIFMAEMQSYFSLILLLGDTATG